MKPLPKTLRKVDDRGYRKGYAGFLLVLPATLIMLLIFAYPLFVNIRTSFHRVLLMDPRGGQPFVGFDNYVRVLSDSGFWRAAQNSLVWTISSVTLQLILGLATALLLNKAIKFRGPFRGAMLIPWVTPGVVAAMTWKWMYDGQFGIISHILVRIGIIDKPIVWLGNVDTALPAVIFEHAWKNFPFVAVMLLASMQTISLDLYEAANLDGTGSWGRFRYVTLPSIMPTLKLTALLTGIWAFNNFDTIWLMTEGGPVGRTDTLTTFVYKATFQAFNLGRASAIAVIMFLILLLFVIIYSRSLRREQ